MVVDDDLDSYFVLLFWSLVFYFISMINYEKFRVKYHDDNLTGEIFGFAM